MAHDVPRREARDRDALHAIQDLERVPQARLAVGRQVGLRDVACHHRARAEADAGQEHLDLLDRRVLRLVEDDECLVQRAAAHERQRRDLDDISLDQARDAVETNHLVERVVHRPEVRVHLLRQVARQETEPLTRLHGGPHQHEPAHALALHRLHGTCHGEIGLAGTRRTDAESEVVRADRMEVLLLVCAAPADQAAQRLDRVLVVRRTHAHAALLDREVHVLGRHRLAARALVEQAQHRGPRGGVRAAHREAPGTAADLDAQAVLDLVQVLVERPADRGEPRIVFRAEVDAGLGGGVQATSRPRSEFGIASVMQTSAKRSTSECGPSKFTQRMFSVRPASWRGSRRECFSTSTRCVLPTMPR